MFKLKFSILFIAFSLISCNSNAIYSDFNTDFESNRWNSNEVTTFEFDITEEIQVGSIKLHIGHIYDFQFANVPMEINIIAPDGSSETVNINVKFKDEKGKDLADCSGDVCDLYTSIVDNKKLIKGKYKFEVKNKFESPFLPNILGVGISIEK